MKKLVSLILIFMLLAAVLSGCGGKSGAAQGSGESKTPNTEAEIKKAAEDLEKAMETLAVKGWPKDKLPAELPEYTEGEIINSGGDAATFYVKIDKTNQKALDNYLGKLTDSGWDVSEGSSPEVRKGIYEIEFDWQGNSMLQMAVYTAELGAWPKDKLPPDIIPPENCTIIGEVEILENGENMWYFNYQCEGIDEAAAKAYFDILIEQGWQGDISQISKDFEWNGKKYSASIEIYETLSTSSTFTCNFYISN